MKRVIAVALIVLVFPASANAQEPRAILSDLAGQVTHGWVHNGIGYEAMEERLGAGKRVYVTCGYVSILAQRALERAGIPSRLVGSFSLEDANLRDVPDTRESHAMIEVWDGESWALYDLDSNVQPVNRRGEAITLSRFVEQDERRYRVLATDSLNALRGSPFPRYERWIFAEHEAWYDRVLGTPTVMVDGEYVYAGANERLAETPGYRRISQAEWKVVVRSRPSPGGGAS